MQLVKVLEAKIDRAFEQGIRKRELWFGRYMKAVRSHWAVEAQLKESKERERVLKKKLAAKNFESLTMLAFINDQRKVNHLFSRMSKVGCIPNSTFHTLHNENLT